ncbi:helix-turn-helix domain-containing protein [Fluviicola sp.]|uniref:helix-turn-helix domain-containing protein n=1 Tax=Fluviicola sp. TaxID=1917219 RepID=UPI0031E1EEE6
MPEALEYQFLKPGNELADFVDSFWRLENHSDSGKEIIVVPDGRVDLFISHSKEQGFHITLSGLESEPECVIFEAQTRIFAISFNLLAVEYILEQPISSILNGVSLLPVDFWGFKPEDLSDFDAFCTKSSRIILENLQKKTIDPRKQKLFELIYANKGEYTVHELSEAVNWSERQINRYFNDRFGISLKSYSTILRFRASFSQIKEGKLFPEQNFTDQAHFIKEVKKFSGVTPKELHKNTNDRFIQFSTLHRK